MTAGDPWEDNVTARTSSYCGAVDVAEGCGFRELFFIDLRQRSIDLLFHLSMHSLVDSSRVVDLYLSFCVERNIFREFLSPPSLFFLLSN